MIKVIYGKKGTPVSDFEAESWVDFNIENYLNSRYPDNIIYTPNELVLILFGVKVLEGLIPISDIEFYFEDEKLEFDETLGLQNPKDRVIGIFSNAVEKSLNLSYAKVCSQKKNK